MCMAMCKLAFFFSALLALNTAWASETSKTAPKIMKKAKPPVIGFMAPDKPSLVVSPSAKNSVKTPAKKSIILPSVVARENLEVARTAYERGDYAHAARAYESIPSSEPEFLRTREELAWSYLRAEDWKHLRGILPHLNSKLVPLRWRLEGRVLSAMMYLRDCQYEEVKNDIEMFQSEMRTLDRKVEAKTRAGLNPGYWRALKAEIDEAVFKMRFVKVELRSRLVLLTREQMHEGHPTDNNGSERIAANAQVYPVTGEFWADELFKAHGEGSSSCAAVHKVNNEKVTQ